MKCFFDSPSVKRAVVIVSFIWLMTGCKQPMCSIQCFVSSAKGMTIYLIHVPFGEKVEEVMDSAKVMDGNTPITFLLPVEDDRLYKLKLKKSGSDFYFITDSRAIIIRANNLTHNYDAENSPATASLNSFNKRLYSSLYNQRKLRRTYDSLYKIGQAHRAVLLDSQIRSEDSLINAKYYGYADTVNNLAAFLYTYNHIEFESNFEPLKNLVYKAAQRFKKYPGIQQLKVEVTKFIAIYTNEFAIGDTLPYVSAQELDGRVYSTSALKNQYYLIDFWASYCRQCMPYQQAKEELASLVIHKPFTMVSVALDDDMAAIKQITQHDTKSINQIFKSDRTAAWIQLVDTAMWKGNIVNTLQFDSIPMNFLVAPGGVIIGKAITADSLEAFIKQKIK